MGQGIHPPPPPGRFTLPRTDATHPPGQTPSGTHTHTLTDNTLPPPPRDSHCSGRYASDWDAYAVYYCSIPRGLIKPLLGSVTEDFFCENSEYFSEHIVLFLTIFAFEIDNSKFKFQRKAFQQYAYPPAWKLYVLQFLWPPPDVTPGGAWVGLQMNKFEQVSSAHGAGPVRSKAS